MLWLAIFAIYRYIVIFEMLAPVVVVAVVGSWPFGRRLRWAICIGLAIAALAGTTLSFGDRTRLGSKLVEIGVPPIRSPASTLAILTVLQPVGFLIPSFPPEVSFIRIDGKAYPADSGPTKYGDMRRAVA